MARTEIVVGKTIFSAHIADGNRDWLVEKARGQDTYDCVITSRDRDGHEQDFIGTRRVFGGEEIRASIRQSQAVQRMVTEGDQWWASRTVGEIIHYHGGFGEFVRGEIVMEDGRKLMKPIALVGNWTANDLPSRNRNGDIHYPYACRNVIEGKTCRPNVSSVFEADPATLLHKGDPRKMTPISLDVPEMTPEEARRAKLEKLRDRVAAAANAETVEAMLEELRAALAEAQPSQAAGDAGLDITKLPFLNITLWRLERGEEVIFQPSDAKVIRSEITAYGKDA